MGCKIETKVLSWLFSKQRLARSLAAVVISLLWIVTGARAQRIGTPEGLPCNRNEITLYDGIAQSVRVLPNSVRIQIGTEYHTKKVIDLAKSSAVTVKGKVLPASAMSKIRPGSRIRVWSCNENTSIALVELLPKASTTPHSVELT
jgi:hypothetical protein